MSHKILKNIHSSHFFQVAEKNCQLLTIYYKGTFSRPNIKFQLVFFIPHCGNKKAMPDNYLLYRCFEQN